MTSDGAAPLGEESEPTEIESLLPWYAAGRLRRRDRTRVAEAVRNDPDLARQVGLVREELAETICLNESLGAPSARAMDRLMASIEDETVAARKRASARVVAGRFATLLAGLSPRTLALAASAAVLAIALQAFVLVDVLSRSTGAAPTAQLRGAASGHGSYAMVRFAREASAAEITKFLENYQASLVDGPKPGGLYRIKLAVKALAKDELARVVARMRQDRIVEYADASDDIDAATPH